MKYKGNYISAFVVRKPIVERRWGAVAQLMPEKAYWIYRRSVKKFKDDMGVGALAGVKQEEKRQNM